MAQLQIKETKNWHEEMIEYMLANPQVTKKQLAQVFNVTYFWILTVTNSDAFIERLAQRRDEKNFLVDAGLSKKLEALAMMAVEETARKIEQNPEQVPISTLLDTSQMAFKALGFGGHAPRGVDTGQTTVQNNILIADRSALAEARAKMAELRRATNPAPDTSDTGTETKMIEGEVLDNGE